MTITIYDVAREANLSMATVSRVVNGNPNVKPVTRKKVLDVIERLGYRPNAVARGLASKKTTTVGVIIPDISNVFYAELARGIEDIATMYKYNIILSNSDNNEEKELVVLNTLLGKQVDGIVYMGNKITDKLQDELKRANTPVVLAGVLDATEKLPNVNIDYKQSTYAVVTELIGKGHTKIAFLSDGIENTNTRAKYEGYLMALSEAKIELNSELIVELEGNNYHQGTIGWSRLTENKVEATAIFASDDEIAIGALNAAQDAGVKVPDELEVVASNNTKITLMARPQLTTVVQPLYDIGAVAMRLLTKLLNKEEITSPHVTLPYSIQKRGTTK